MQQQSPDLLLWNCRITLSSSAAAKARKATASDVSMIKIELKDEIVNYRYTERKMNMSPKS